MPGVSERHEVSPQNARDHRTHDILAKLEAGQPVSQRSLSRELGIALGLTNLLLRQMTRKGLVRLRRIKPNRVRYLITPAGVAEKARLSHKYLRDSIAFYSEARRRIQESFVALIQAHGDGPRPMRVVFWGAGELAEIGYICLQENAFTLVAVIDDARAGARFFGHSVQPSSSLVGNRVDGEAFDTLVVISLEDESLVTRELSRISADLQRVFWIATR